MSQNDSACFDDWSDAEHCIEQAHDFYDQGYWQEALRELQAALDINATNSNWLFNKGLTLDTLERYHDAIEAYQAAHELDPNDPEILNCLGIDYIRVGQYDLSLQTFEKLEHMAPDFEPAFCNRVIAYSELGQHEKAEEMFYLARQLKENCSLCYYNMGNSLFSRQLYDRAIWCWQQTRSLDPHHPQIEYRTAQAYWAKGDLSRAKEHFLAELKRAPGDIEVLLDTALLLLEMNDLDSAQEKFRRILELDSSHAPAHHYLGELHLHRGKLAQAVESFNRALALNPHQNGSHFRLGECFVQLGQLANAREHLLAELKLSPDQPEVLLDLGCLLEQVGQTTEAMRCFERVIETRPSDPTAYQNLSLCYYQSGLIDQGMDLSAKVLELDPNHVPALHNLAYAHRQKCEFGPAQQYIRRACELAPYDRQLKLLKRSIICLNAYHNFTRPLQRLRSTTKKLFSRR